MKMTIAHVRIFFNTSRSPPGGRSETETAVGVSLTQHNFQANVLRTETRCYRTSERLRSYRAGIGRGNWCRYALVVIDLI